MSQNQVNYGIDPSGAQLLDELLSGEQQNRLTMDGGNSRPSYAMEGTVWTDKSVENFVTLKRFDGTSDVVLMTINEQTGTITIPGIADTDLSNLSGTGLNRFANRDLSNLSTTGKDYVAFKGYNVSETYSLNDLVVNVDVNNEVKIYQSLADNNTSSLSDTTKWKEVSLGGGGAALPLLTHFWSDHEIDNISYYRADTFSWLDGTVYSNAYNHLVDDIDGITANTETVGGYTVTYYQATDGHKIVLADQETVVGNIYTATGVAWYYVLDTANNRFKLPRENPNYEELDKYTFPSKANVDIANTTFSGRSTPAALVGQRANFVTTASAGQLYVYGTGSTAISSNSQAAALDADLSGISKSSYYKGKKFLYFYVGQYTQSAVEQTAGLNAELFNGKADVDASNFNATGKSTLVSLCIPDYSAGSDVTASAFASSGTGYQPTKDGVLYISAKLKSGDSYIYLYIYDGAGQNIVTPLLLANDNASGVNVGAFVPADKNYSYRVPVTGTGNNARFLPYKGA